jgi:hypothetical protein
MRNSDLHRTTLSALRNPRVYSRFGFFTEALSVLIRVHPRPIQSSVFKSFANIKSVFICTTYLQTLKILLSIRDTILDNCWNLLTLMIS